MYMGPDHVGDVPLHMKIAAGLTTGGLAISIASPTDLVKVGWAKRGGEYKSGKCRVIGMCVCVCVHGCLSVPVFVVTDVSMSMSVCF